MTPLTLFRKTSAVSPRPGFLSPVFQEGPLALDSSPFTPDLTTGALLPNRKFRGNGASKVKLDMPPFSPLDFEERGMSPLSPIKKNQDLWEDTENRTGQTPDSIVSYSSDGYADIGDDDLDLDSDDEALFENSITVNGSDEFVLADGTLMPTESKRVMIAESWKFSGLSSDARLPSLRQVESGSDLNRDIYNKVQSNFEALLRRLSSFEKADLDQAKTNYQNKTSNSDRKRQSPNHAYDQAMAEHLGCTSVQIVGSRSKEDRLPSSMIDRIQCEFTPEQLGLASSDLSIEKVFIELSPRVLNKIRVSIITGSGKYKKTEYVSFKNLETNQKCKGLLFDHFGAYIQSLFVDQQLNPLEMDLAKKKFTRLPWTNRPVHTALREKHVQEMVNYASEPSQTPMTVRQYIAWLNAFEGLNAVITEGCSEPLSPGLDIRVPVVLSVSVSGEHPVTGKAVSVIYTGNSEKGTNAIDDFLRGDFRPSQVANW